ncbi:hypothetical protein IWQ61_004182 [Dispira simplex]|nr:hypothetical protein IWQ61_004182 [Dispira simplex]
MVVSPELKSPTSSMGKSSTTTMKFAKILPHPKGQTYPISGATASIPPPLDTTTVQAGVVPTTSSLQDFLSASIVDDMLSCLDPVTTSESSALAQTVFDEWMGNDLSYVSPTLSDLTLVNSPPAMSIDPTSGESTPVANGSPMLASLPAPEKIEMTGTTTSGLATPTLPDFLFSYPDSTPNAMSDYFSLLAQTLQPATKSASTSTSAVDTLAPSVVQTLKESVKYEETIRKRQSDFLSSLPPEIALKRRRTSSSKRKAKLAESLAAPVETKPAVDDPVALKRQKNTDAARRSRMRKMLRIDTLESRVVELETENNSLLTKVAVLEAEKASVKDNEAGLLERIRVLESQLSTAHCALATTHSYM